MSEKSQPRQAQLGTYVTMIVGLLFLFLLASQAGKYQQNGLVVTKVAEKMALRDERQKTLMKIGAEPVCANYTGINLPPVVMQAGGNNQTPIASGASTQPAGASVATAGQANQTTVQTAPAATVKENEPRVYVVRPGETLFVISQKVYGDGNRWREILSANPEVPSPNKLSSGMRLKVPAPEQQSAAYRRWVAQAAQTQEEAVNAPATSATANSRNTARRRN